MTLGQNGVLRYGHFSDFSSIFGNRMAILGLIDFKFGLYIKVVYKIHLLARRTQPNGGTNAAGRPSAERDDRVSCIQISKLM